MGAESTACGRAWWLKRRLATARGGRRVAPCLNHGQELQGKVQALLAVCLGCKREMVFHQHALARLAMPVTASSKWALAASECCDEAWCLLHM